MESANRTASHVHCSLGGTVPISSCVDDPSVPQNADYLGDPGAHQNSELPLFITHTPLASYFPNTAAGPSTIANFSWPILFPEIQKPSPVHFQTTYPLSSRLSSPPSLSIPPEQQRVGSPLVFVGQPDIGERTRHDPMIRSCPDVALSLDAVSAVPPDHQILEDVHTSGRGNNVFSLAMHPNNHQYSLQARPTALTMSTGPSHPPPQTRSPQVIDDSSAGTSSSSSSIHSSIDAPLNFSNNWSLDSQLQERASAIMSSGWFISNGREPRLHKEELVRYGLSRQEYSGSLFDQFIDASPRHGCLFFNDNGRCPHQASRPGRARSHAYDHFSYAPFACGGNCGKASCSKRFTSDGALNGHYGRKNKPTRQCPKCPSEVTVQNFSRHMKISVPPGFPTQTH